MRKKSKNIVLVLCVKNEFGIVKDVISGARNYVDKILVIEGHSNEGTYELLRKEKGIILMRDNKKGKGDAIKIAIENSHKNEILVFMDADGSHEPKDISKLVDKIDEGFDLVIASRGQGGSDELSGSFEKNIRLIGSTIITLIINLRFKSLITDSQNGFRAIKVSVAKKLMLSGNGFSIEQEMLMRILKLGYKVTEVPSHEYARKYGHSKIVLWIETWRYLKSLIKGVCF